jgi:CheY-like chemotaxis protein
VFYRASVSAKASYSILVVEDNIDQAQSLAFLLQAMGHKAEFVTDARNAALAALDVKPDLIFLDLGLPYIDGYELIGIVRKQLKRRVPVVALTGYGTQADRDRSREAGFDAHILKPADSALLEATIITIMEVHKRRLD